MKGNFAKLTLSLLMLCCLSVRVAGAADPAGLKNVLVLFPQDGWAIPAYRMVYNGMKSVFSRGADFKINLFSENLDFSLNSGDTAQQRLVEFLRTKYAGNHIHAIVPVTLPAMHFVLRYRDTAFPNIPVVFCLLNSDDLSLFSRGPHITGVALDLDVSDTIAIARQLHPGLKRLAVVAGTGPTDRYLVSITRQAFDNFSDNLEWIDLTGLPVDDLLSKVSRLPQSTAILYLTVQRDGVGNNLVSAETQRMVSASANAPLYNFIDSAIGYGSVGGRMVSIEVNGRETAELILRILAGENAGAIEPVIIRENPYLFDWREMKRWGIKESALPPNSIVRFKAPNYWDLYSGWIVTLFTFILLQMLLLVSLFFNMTKRKRIAATLARSQANLSRAQEIAQIGSFRFSVPLDEVVWSMGAREIYGVSADRKIDYNTLLSIVHPDDRQFVDKSWKNALQGEGYDIEHRIVVADKVKWVREKVDFDFGKDGKPMSGTGIVRDISQRKKLESESSTLNRELAHVGRLSVVGELGQSLAHEINQPLAAILANAEAAMHLLSADTPDIAEVCEALRDIVADNKRAQSIIQRIRSLVKKTSHAHSLVDINTVVKVAVALVEGHARGRQVDIFLSLTPERTIVKGDTIQLQQVILNLLVNAMEALDSDSPGKRRININTERLETGIIHLSISDSGGGIDTQTAKRLFEPFFTTKKNGLGLGLSISRSIIESHGGSIDTESGPDRGATFHIHLPAVLDTSPN